MGRLFVFMGKSASGKDTLYGELLARYPEIHAVIPYTTRPIREGETDGGAYYFVSEDKMRRMEKENRIVESRCYQTVHGPWYYFTAEDGQIDWDKGDFVLISTLEGFEKISRFYGADKVVPLYIEVDDMTRIERSLKREKEQKNPCVSEVCRRFLADEKDFSKERLDQCGIIKQYENTGIEPCIEEIIKDILCNEGKEKQMLKKIGFIGVGIMGKSMVRNLMKAGYEVSIYTRTKSKVEDVIAEGAVWCDTVADCSKGRDVVITIVGYPKDVEEVYFGENGILENADKGTYVIDMTTTSPKLDQQIYEEAKKRGLHGLDAPVTGGDSGAKAGTLTILVGGDKEDFDTCLPVFEAMGKAINYEGKSGNGQHTKMCNQIAIAGALAGACEAMVYAKNAGLDVDVMLKSISTGAAGSAQMNNVASKAAKDDYAPGFFLKHFIKDMSLADEEASERGTKLDVLEDVLGICKKLEEEGMGDLGTQALIKHYKW